MIKGKVSVITEVTKQAATAAAAAEVDNR